MRWFLSTVEGAGLARFKPWMILLTMVMLASLFGLFVAELIGIAAFGLFLGIGALAFEFEFLSLIAASRRRKIAKLWPEVIDSVSAALVAGLSISDAFDELRINGPRQLGNHFELLSRSLDSGSSFEQALDNLKSSIGEVHADKFCETLRLANASGSELLVTSLKLQSKNLRSDLSLMGQLEAKQGWVVGTAKIAVSAPWVVVALLSLRPENSQFYNSELGSQILFLGFIVCIFAYRLVQFLGRLPVQPRSFTS